MLSLYLKASFDKKLFSKCFGKKDLKHLPPDQFDAYIRMICGDLTFFYEDYIEAQIGVTFETIYIEHLIACRDTDFSCFCNYFKRVQLPKLIFLLFNIYINNFIFKPDNRLDMSEHLGQEYRRNFLILFIIDLFESYLRG